MGEGKNPGDEVVTGFHHYLVPVVLGTRTAGAGSNGNVSHLGDAKKRDIEICRADRAR